MENRMDQESFEHWSGIVARGPTEAPRNSWVYFIQAASGHIKIGVGTNPAHRLRQLQTAHPLPLRMLKKVLGSQKDEQALHGRFGDARVSGEWFRPTEALMAYIEGL